MEGAPTDINTELTEEQKDAQALAIAEQIFSKYDADHSGFIEINEAKIIFMEVLKKMKSTKINVPDAQLNQWFNMADVNSDGQISIEEAKNFIKNHMMKQLLNI